MMIDKLKKLGLKATPQRLAILKLLDGNEHHPSAEEIYKQLKPDYPSLSLATVYNTLEALAKAGELQEIRITADRKHFDPDPSPHTHFLCRNCNSIYDLYVNPGDIKTTCRTKGYLVENYVLNLYGICPGCQEKEKRKEGNGG
ncbi:MAG: transcriptional repressor [Peptococcaceae bacterium]|nr:transcriptional repressor [Peptococcaceae bacterium]